MSSCILWLNRRFYRQGINWAVAGFKVIINSELVSVNICKCPNTWVMSNAWEKSFRHWQQMNAMSSWRNESIRPRFLDFKVYADQVIMHAAGFIAANLMPYSIPSGWLLVCSTPGEWEMSKVCRSSNRFYDRRSGWSWSYRNRRYLIPGAGASGLNAVSPLWLKDMLLLEDFLMSRSECSRRCSWCSESHLRIGWLQLFQWRHWSRCRSILMIWLLKIILHHIHFENDGVNVIRCILVVPNQLTWSEWHDFVTFIFETNVTSGIGIQRLKGGNFPCGLIAVDWTPDQSANLFAIKLI